MISSPVRIVKVIHDEWVQPLKYCVYTCFHVLYKHVKQFRKILNLIFIFTHLNCVNNYLDREKIRFLFLIKNFVVS